MIANKIMKIGLITCLIKSINTFQKVNFLLNIDFFNSKELNYFSTMTFPEVIFKLNFNLFFTLYCSLKTKKKQ